MIRQICSRYRNKFNDFLHKVRDNSNLTQLRFPFPERFWAPDHLGGTTQHRRISNELISYSLFRHLHKTVILKWEFNKIMFKKSVKKYPSPSDLHKTSKSKYRLTWLSLKSKERFYWKFFFFFKYKSQTFDKHYNVKPQRMYFWKIPK